MPPLNEDQALVVSDREGPRVVLAGPGAGKTTTMVKFIERLMESGVPAHEIRALTFSKEMAKTLEKRIGMKGIASTFHSLGYLICSQHERKPVEPELRLRLLFKLCKQYGLEYKDLTGFISKMRRENISPADAAEQYGFGRATAYDMYERTRKKEGWMDFDSMLRDSVDLLENTPAARARWQVRYLIVDEAQDTENCHPAGTLVRKLIGGWGPHHKARWQEVPIETLKNGDSVVLWSRRYANLTFKPQPISIGTRPFAGDLIKVVCGSRSVEVTPDHKFYVTLNGREKDTYVVYLMHKADRGFRVGQCRMRYCGETPKKRKSVPDLGHRFMEEGAERGWILRVCDTRSESLVWEQIFSCNFGIPYATYGTKKQYCPARKRTAEVSALIFENTSGRGEDCLTSVGLDFRYPLYTRTSQPSRRYFITEAMNLLPNIMSLPAPAAYQQDEITHISRRPFNGLVYSLNVPKHHTYVANGLVTHNCQWRMMQLMSEKHGNITVVGDPGQCIYSFRGAKPENITNFEQWFPGGRYFYLGRNYRSTENIINFVRENAPPEIPQELLARMLPARSEKGAPIGFRMYWKDEDEAEAALVLANKDPLNSIILVRTNHWVGMLQRLCGRYKVRYHLMGETSFWKQNEIRKAIEALKLYPTLELEAALNMTLPQMESKYAVDDRTERDNDALENLKGLRGYVGDFRMAKDFVVYANKMMHRRNDPYGVSLATVHQAKGLEFKNVFVLGANCKTFPHIKGDPVEEKRIFYVAISRAIDRLRISFSGTPSIYLRRYITPEILDKLRETALDVQRLQEQTKLFS